MLTEASETLGVCQYTTGEWLDEPSAMTALDEALEASGLFRVYREVRGDCQQPRFNIAVKDHLKIDRVLVPNKKCLEAGWSHGCVDVEGKQPQTAIGPVVCQCLDYGRTVWHLRDIGQWVMCPWTFIWHLSDFAGDIASVMAQHRIGGVYSSKFYLLNFKHAGGSIFRVQRNTGLVEFKEAKCGLKSGSR
jgi:hypothetical protein